MSAAALTSSASDISVVAVPVEGKTPLYHVERERIVSYTAYRNIFIFILHVKLDTHLELHAEKQCVSSSSPAVHLGRESALKGTQRSQDQEGL